MSIYIFANTKIEVNRAVVRSKNFILIEGMFGMNAAVSEREDLNNFFWSTSKVVGTRAIVKLYCANEEHYQSENLLEEILLDGEVDYSKANEETTLNVEGQVPNFYWENLANQIHTNHFANLKLVIPSVNAGIFTEDEFEIRAKVELKLELLTWQYEINHKQTSI